MHRFALDIKTALDTFFNGQTLGAHVLQGLVIIGLAVVLLFLFDRLIELVTPKVAKRADVITTDENVLRLRRAETFIGLGLTIFRVLVVVTAIFLIWHLTSPSSGPIALIGVGTVAILLASATVVPLLRDMTYGFIMIAERWYNIGDHVVVEPFPGSGGVVERMTLRSTKLRSVNGEAIWIHHQHVQAMRITSAASHPLIIETFVNDPRRGKQVLEDSFKILPSGATTIPQPPTITEVKQISEAIWRITAICEVTPFREWMIEKFAIKVITKTDELTGQTPVIVHGPIVYYADATADKRYQRSAAVRKRIRSGDAKPTRKA